MSEQFVAARQTLGRLSLTERLLLLFCVQPSRCVPGNPVADDPLARLKARSPNVVDAIKDKRVLDLGCGDGDQSIALAKAGAASVTGIDINRERINRARWKAVHMPAVQFAADFDGKFDVIICQDAFEHFADPEGMMSRMVDAIDIGGMIFLTFGPLWYAPYGAHCHYFTKLPWVHLLFSERTVHRVMALYNPNPGVSFTEDMNMMTLARFERIMASTTNCAFEDIEFHCVKRLSFLSRIPLVRELMVNEVSCVVRKARTTYAPA